MSSQKGEHIISNGKIKADLSNTTDVREIQEPVKVKEDIKFTSLALFNPKCQQAHLVLEC